MTRTQPRRSDAEYKMLARQWLPRCKGSFSLADPDCAKCKALNDCGESGGWK